MRRGKRWLLLLTMALVSPGQAAQMWAQWELDLNGHAPPTYFVLNVSSPTGTPVPPPLEVPWASCTGAPGAQHCAPIGCPPVGTYDFVVHAHYEEGLSGPSNTWRCTIVQNGCYCSEIPGLHPPRPPIVTIPPTRVVPGPTVPAGVLLSSEIPPLVPVGEIPTLPTIPAIPASGGA